MTKKALKLRKSFSTGNSVPIRKEWAFSTVLNKKSYALTFGHRNWTVLQFAGKLDFMHAQLRKNNVLALLCNEYGNEGIEGFLGNTPLRLVQGINIKPTTASGIAPFAVYATNNYGMNTNRTTKNTSRFDIIEVDVGEEQSMYRLVLAILVHGEN